MKAARRAVDALFDKNLTVATAESCTGGMISAELVAFPGISALFKEGFITYSNDAKQKRLGVSADTLMAHGAVSEETARQMAVGAKQAAGADIGIASTGIAGPDGGTAEKPVGLVYLSCALGDKVVTRRFVFPGNRYQIRFASTKEAFKLLCDSIEKYGS